ncbi:hypothetical protein CNYM01_06541 [Colletotrichum nymphaeae SA-01]|uniref:Nephrocystin 3-like N-terminal domain-containing protein n=1 Tax=Colletotrichum nymphaeae SA-01 TaxID=1460502 RepID=A0A135U8D7_9PEZI|nr:hypothetical protein CNYM01_06541 [Colletotrichum nymphaeae SA-01]
MSGLEALGLACNIFQVISFGRETASLIKRVYRDGTVDDVLEANAKDLAQLAAHSIDANLRQFLHQYQQGDRDTSDLISAELFRIRNHVTHESQKATAQIKSMVDQQSAQLDQAIKESNQEISTAMIASSLDRDLDARRRCFLASLKFSGMNERRNQVNESCKDTFQWIFANDTGCLEDSYHRSNLTKPGIRGSGRDDISQNGASDWRDASTKQNYTTVQNYGIRWDSNIDWLKCDSSIFWCSGKPGSGKSTLMRYIISDARTRSALKVWGTNPLVVSHFFWRPGTLMQQSIRGMFCSLLHQPLTDELSALDRSMSNIPTSGQKDSEIDWTAKELQTLFFNTIQQYNRPIYFFLDGIDEVRPEDGVLRLLEITHNLCTIPNVKICASSRPEYIIEKYLGDGRHPVIRLQDLTAKDLRLYAERHNKFPPGFKIRSCCGPQFHRYYH